MSENSKIEWTDHTFNPWEGCQEVSPGCNNCYAKTRNARFGGGTAINWGPDAPRRRTSTANWAKPRAWDRAHAEFFAVHGRRQRVFCASLADVFDNAVDPQWRADLFELIGQTPNLDWLLLTKRIGNVGNMLPVPFDFDRLYPNVWLGATIVNQEEADRDIPKLLALPARVRFLSMEPLLGSVDLSKWIDPWTCSNCGHHGSESESGPCRCDLCNVATAYDSTVGSDRCPSCRETDCQKEYIGNTCPNCGIAERWGRDYGYKFDSEHPALLDWVIVGGESGAGARPMHPDWAFELRDQCAAAGVPFLFKQWGEWLPAIPGKSVLGKTLILEGQAPFTDKPEWHHFEDGVHAARIGKKAAGRLLDGVQHDGYPDQNGIAECIGCGCHDFHACAAGCWWLRVDYAGGRGVCSQCEGHVAAWDTGERGGRLPAVAPHTSNHRDGAQS